MPCSSADKRTTTTPGFERTIEVYLLMNGVNNDWLPVEAEAHQSWPPKNKRKCQTNRQRKKEQKTKYRNTC